MTDQQPTMDAQRTPFVPSEREAVVVQQYRQRQQERRAAVAQLHRTRSSASRP